MFLGTMKDLADLLGSRLPGSCFLLGNCSLLLFHPTWVVIIRHVTVGKVRMVVVAASTAIAVAATAKQTAAAVASCSLTRVGVAILMMA